MQYRLAWHNVMSFYTVGHRENYRAAIAQHGEILKQKGGYAFHRFELACQFLEEHSHVEDWAIWELHGFADEDMEVSTNPSEYWGLINRDIPIGNEVPYRPTPHEPNGLNWHIEDFR